MEKLNMQTENTIEKNIAWIGQRFPNCITEVIDEKTKNLRHVVDFEKLKQELASDIVEGREERYQFTWPDKKKAVLLANSPISATLRPCREESVDFDKTENLYIEGDNLDVLKCLKEAYLGKVKMIYIDPPYNTGNDFVYEDDFAETTAEYMANSGQYDEQGNRLVTNSESNGRFHTDWLNMIYPRLKVARDLLTDDGVIFISIDDNEVENLRKVCDEIFGENNLVAQIPWQSRASIQNDTDLSINHEYILVFSKVRRQENRRLKDTNYKEWHKTDSFVCRPLPLDKSKFSNPDNDERGLWKADPFDAPNIRPNLTYPIMNPITGIQHLPPRGRHWRTDNNQFSSALADGRILFGQNGTGRPQLKVFYDEKKEFGSIDNSWFSSDRIGTTTNGTKEVMKIFDGVKYFDMPKPTSLLGKLLYLSNVKSDSIILDFFSGSATTAHAVMKLNAEDGGKRKFIMVQLPEKTDEKSEANKAGYKNICEIGKERIRRAGKKIKEEKEEELSKKREELYHSCDGAIESTNTSSINYFLNNATIEQKELFNKLSNEYSMMKEAYDTFDTGFRVLKLDSSNMEDIYYAPSEYSQENLFAKTENVKADRTAHDLLFQVMLELGATLDSKIEQSSIEGKTIFNVADGYLVACFDTNINDAVVAAIAKMQPQYAVFRDSSMADDITATNFEQLFKTYAPSTTTKVL